MFTSSRTARVMFGEDDPAIGVWMEGQINSVLALLYTSPNHPIRPHQHIRRNRQADLLRGIQIGHEFKLHRLLDGQIGGLGVFENLVDVSRSDGIF